MRKEVYVASVAPVTYAYDQILEWEGATHIGGVETSM